MSFEASAKRRSSRTPMCVNAMTKSTCFRSSRAFSTATGIGWSQRKLLAARDAIFSVTIGTITPKIPKRTPLHSICNVPSRGFVPSFLRMFAHKSGWLAPSTLRLKATSTICDSRLPMTLAVQPSAASRGQTGSGFSGTAKFPAFTQSPLSKYRSFSARRLRSFSNFSGPSVP